LDHGADINANPAGEGLDQFFGGMRGALHWAAFSGDTELTAFLLSRGANVNQPSVSGSPLVQAAWGGHASVAKILLDHGATVDQRDLLAGYTALHWAASAENSRADLVELLLARGADPSAEGGQSVDSFLGVPQTPSLLPRQGVSSWYR
jgi:ankyrin repeat protein